MPVSLTVRSAVLGFVAAVAAAGCSATAWANPMPGIEILDDTSSCTAGFAVAGGAGSHYLLTSGHCASDDGSPWVDAQDNPLGTIVDIENNGGDHDMAAILLVSAAGMPSGDVAGHRVRDALSPDQITVGMTLCKLGARTGETCGDVTSVGGNTVEANVFSIEGDSGSPGYVVNPDGTASAVGILAGGPEGDDTKSYFIMVGPLLPRWGLRLLP
ncbi:MAG TPA: trypsin [Mycobacterium sp.]|nr:trypsin [Mycobacterium sp.]